MYFVFLICHCILCHFDDLNAFNIILMHYKPLNFLNVILPKLCDIILHFNAITVYCNKCIDILMFKRTCVGGNITIEKCLMSLWLIMCPNTSI